MKNAKTKVLKVVAKAGMRSAVKSSGAASTYIFHQPKEPAVLKQMNSK